jgi:hypothetical protein
MANALHFVRDKEPVLRRMHSYLKEGGHPIIVEYDMDRGNQWEPFPFSYATWEQFAQQNGFTATRRLHTVPSSFLGQIYSAVSVKRNSELFGCMELPRGQS